MAVTRQISSKKNQTKTNNNNEIQEPNSCKPTKPVIRLIGGRIIDSQNGKSCHQCRLKTMYFTVTCKNKDVHRRMPVHHYCHKCLWRRYGEKAEEVAALVDWKCPKCRGICNCSYCRMRRGHQPARILMHTTKANGVSSVSNKLRAEGSKKVKTKKGAISNKRNASDEEPIAVLLKKFRNGIDGMSDSKWKHRPFKKSKMESGASSNKVNISNEDTLAVLLKKYRKDNGANGTSHSMPKSRPTGILPHPAKENGSSVSDMLSAHNKCDVSDEEPLAIRFKNWRKDNGVYGTSDSKLKHMPFENGGDSEKTEGSKLKMLRKNYFSHNNSTEDAGASINKPTTSDKEYTAGLVRITTRKNGLGRESDLKFQPKSPIMERIEKGTENSMLQHLRNDQELGSLYEGSGQKDSVKKSDQLKFYCRRSKRDQSIKISHGKYVPKEVSKDMVGFATDETDPTHEKEAVVEKNPVEEFHLCRRKKKEVHDDNSIIEAHLPQGVELTKLANIDMPADDIGHALQFLEFCEAFGQVLDLKKGQSEMLLAELACGKKSHRDLNVSVVQLHIKLLSFIQQNSGKDYSSLETRCCTLWLEDLKNCVLESECPSKEQFIDILQMGTGGYEELNFSKKLRLLNFLCDEVLGTLEFRSWILRQNFEFIKEEQRAARDKVLADKEKVKNMKKQLEGEVAATILMRSGEPLSMSEHENLISKIKAEIAQTLAETLQGLDSGMKKEPRSDAVRSEPKLLDADGRIFWKLKSYSDSIDILFQDVHKEDPTTFKEVWYAYEVHDKEVVENYINHHLRNVGK